MHARIHASGQLALCAAAAAGGCTLAPARCDAVCPMPGDRPPPARKKDGPVCTLYLVRHAESTWNKAFAGCITGVPETLAFLLNPIPLLTDRDHPITDEVRVDTHTLTRTSQV